MNQSDGASAPGPQDSAGAGGHNQPADPHPGPTPDHGQGHDGPCECAQMPLAGQDAGAATDCAEGHDGPGESCAEPFHRFKDATEVGDYHIANYPPFSVWQVEQTPAFEGELKRERPGAPAAVQPLGLYVHLPFCRQRCYYCYFRVHPNVRPATVDDYIDAVLIEAAMYREHPAIAGRPLRHVYLGGGTPTYLTTQQLERLISGLKNLFPWQAVEEFTIECDPGTVTLNKFLTLRKLGVNRVSMGFQTLTPGLGFRIGRLSGRNDCIEAYWHVRSAGIETINIDMLAGLQGEILQSWLWSVGQVAQLEPEAITMCQMQLTHNSKYFAQKRSGRALPLPTWNDKREWVGSAFEWLERHGWKVVDGYTAVREPQGHTARYTAETLWAGGDLLALGESAFGYLNGFNYQNTDTLETYLTALRSQHLPVRRAYKLSADEQLRRSAMLTLKSGRLDRAQFRARFGVDVVEAFQDTWAFLEAEKLATIGDAGVRLTRSGLLEVDALLPLLYREEHKDVRYT